MAYKKSKTIAQSNLTSWYCVDSMFNPHCESFPSRLQLEDQPRYPIDKNEKLYKKIKYITFEECKASCINRPRVTATAIQKLILDFSPRKELVESKLLSHRTPSSYLKLSKMFPDLLKEFSNEEDLLSWYRQSIGTNDHKHVAEIFNHFLNSEPRIQFIFYFLDEILNHLEYVSGNDEDDEDDENKDDEIDWILLNEFFNDRHDFLLKKFSIDDRQKLIDRLFRLSNRNMAEIYMSKLIRLGWFTPITIRDHYSDLLRISPLLVDTVIDSIDWNNVSNLEVLFKTPGGEYNPGVLDILWKLIRPRLLVSQEIISEIENSLNIDHLLHWLIISVYGVSKFNKSVEDDALFWSQFLHYLDTEIDKKDTSRIRGIFEFPADFAFSSLSTSAKKIYIEWFRKFIKWSKNGKIFSPINIVNTGWRTILNFDPTLVRDYPTISKIFTFL